MRVRNPSVNVRLNVRPLRSNWKPVRDVERSPDEREVWDSGLDKNVWKTRANLEALSDDEPSTAEEVGVIAKCDCGKCTKVEQTPTVVEKHKVRQMPIKNVPKKPGWSKLYGEKKEGKHVEVDRKTPPAPPPSLILNPNSYQQGFEHQPALVPQPISHVEPPNVQPAPVDSLLQMVVQKAKESVSITKKNPPIVVTPESLSAPPAPPSSVVGEKLKMSKETEEKLEDIVIVNELPRMEIEDVSFIAKIEKMFYASETNMWLLIALVILTVFAYRSSMDSQMCYYD